MLSTYVSSRIVVCFCSRARDGAHQVEGPRFAEGDGHLDSPWNCIRLGMSSALRVSAEDLREEVVDMKVAVR